MENILVVSVISSTGLGLSLFFGFFLLKDRRLDNNILALLLIILTLRMTKSIFYSATDLPLFVKNLGLAANTAIGPLLFLYGKVLLGKRKIETKQYFHFIPALIYVLLCNSIPNEEGSLLWAITYSAVLIHSFAYVFFSLIQYAKMKDFIDQGLRRWYLQVTLSLSAIWLVYTLIFLTIIPTYSFGPLAFSILMFLLVYVGLNTKKLFQVDVKKYASSKMTDEEGQAVLSQIRRLMEDDKMYLKSDLNLATLAEATQVSERVVSLVINRHTNQNFASFVNKYRIDDAIRKLDSSQNEKILAIALDVGFNNLSSFNQAFKSATGKTPSEFRTVKMP
ncbi:MAG: helix-turn-helix domain-containing protein [Cyclobacteriaceae bacterium]